MRRRRGDHDGGYARTGYRRDRESLAARGIESALNGGCIVGNAVSGGSELFDGDRALGVEAYACREQKKLSDYLHFVRLGRKFERTEK